MRVEPVIAGWLDGLTVLHAASLLECAHAAPRSVFLPNDPIEPPERSRRLPGIKVLLVDDEEDARQMTSTFLGIAGAEVRCAESVQDAMEKLRGFEPDAVLCDLMMPEEDGYSFLRRFRSRHAFLHVPVVALTAHCLPSERAYTDRAGFDAHLAKPAAPHEVIASITSLLGR